MATGKSQTLASLALLFRPAYLGPLLRSFFPHSLCTFSANRVDTLKPSLQFIRYWNKVTKGTTVIATALKTTGIASNEDSLVLHSSE